MNNICPACEEGVLVVQSAEQRIPYKGKTLVVANFEYAACPTCGEEVVLSSQEDANQRKLIDARRCADGYRTSKQIVDFRRRWNLTQATASKVFGGGVNAFSKYERCEIVQSQSTDLLMQVIDEIDDAREFVAKLTGVKFSRAVPQANSLWTNVEHSEVVRLHTPMTETSRKSSFRVAAGIYSGKGKQGSWQNDSKVKCA